jgi:hypothetical protein
MLEESIFLLTYLSQQQKKVSKMWGKSKMSSPYAKNVYRNRLTDSHLDDLLRVGYSNYKPDISKIVKKRSQYKKHTNLK